MKTTLRIEKTLLFSKQYLTPEAYGQVKNGLLQKNIHITEKNFFQDSGYFKKNGSMVKPPFLPVHSTTSKVTLIQTEPVRLDPEASENEFLDCFGAESEECDEYDVIPMSDKEPTK